MANHNTLAHHNRYGNLVRNTAFWLAPLALVTACSSSSSNPNTQDTIASSVVLLHAQDVDRAVNGAISEIAARGSIDNAGDSNSKTAKSALVQGIPLDTSQLNQQAAKGYSQSSGSLELSTAYDKNGNLESAAIIADVTCGGKLQTMTTVSLTQAAGLWSISETGAKVSNDGAALQDAETLLGKFNDDLASVAANAGEHTIQLSVLPSMRCAS